MEFIKLEKEDISGIEKMSAMATEIVREHYDPIIGREQNDYMIKLFQSPDAIKEQLDQGYCYYFVAKDNENVGFIAMYPRDEAMYLSKFYLYKSERRKGYSHTMLDFIKDRARDSSLKYVELNVNKNNDAIYAYEKLGFTVLRTEKNSIGSGFYMDDYVYRLSV